MNNFDSVVGQDFAKKLLAPAIKNSGIAHAYLFVGSAHLGKFKLAVEFAKLIQCGADIGRDSEAVRQRCAKIESGIDPDVLLIDSVKDKGDKDSESDKIVSIGDVRKLEHHLSLFPYYSKYKIAIVRDAHKFTDEAVNAFLKTLEEPRGNSVIILVADNIHFLPETLVSRTQIIRFWPVRDRVIEDFLAKEGLDRGEAKKIALISGGKAGLAMEFWKNKEKFLKYSEQKDAFKRFIGGTLEEKFALIDKMTKSEENISDILETWLVYSREWLMAEYLDEGGKTREEAGKKLSAAGLVKFASNLSSIINLINNSNVNKKLALENLALEIPAP